MSDATTRPPLRPTVRELERALWVASYAYTVAAEVIEKGRPSASSFMDLCRALAELEQNIPGGGCDNGEFSLRAEELYELVLEEEKHEPRES